MRYALETDGGVELLSGSSPLPEGAIEPIPNWEDIYGIKPGYLKVVGGDQIVEKTQEEKDEWDENNPPTLDERKVLAQLYLEETDPMVIKEYETGESLPTNISSERAQQRIILGAEEE
jgi:hypothetical protein